MIAQAELVFVRLVIAFMLGILAFHNNGSSATLLVTGACSLFLFCVLVCCNFWYRRLRLYRHKPALTIGIYLLTFFIGGQLTLSNTDNLRKDYFARSPADFLKIRIDDEPQVKNKIIRFKAMVIQAFNHKPSINSHPTSGRILVSFKLDSGTKSTLSYGDVLLVPAKFQPVEEAHNPFQFDVKSWLANQNIYHQSFLKASDIRRISTKQGNPLIAWALTLRKKQVDVYDKYVLNREAFAVASTLILGYRADLSQETLMAYSNTGTIHVLSVSGMHVGIIFLVLNFALGFMENYRTGKLLKLVLILGLIWFYALVSGLSPSVLRSVIMLSVYILAKSFNKNSNSYNIVAFSAFCMLLYNPFLLYDVGFQLSYLSVLGLVYLQPKINCWFTFKYSLMNKLWSAIALSLAAQIATFPLALYYFHQFPIYFLISNLFITIPVALMMYLGLIILLCRFYFLAPLFEWLIRFTNRGLKMISELPFSSIKGIWIEQWQLLVLTACLCLLTLAITNYRKQLFLPGFLALLLFLSSCSYQKWISFNQRKMIFFSLSREYAIALIEGDQATLITSLKPESPFYRSNVAPTLSCLQIAKTTWVFAHEGTRTKTQNIIDVQKLTNSQSTTNARYVLNHQISYFNKSVLIVDSCFNYKTLVGSHNKTMLTSNNNDLQTSTKFNILVLSANSKVNLPQLILKTQPELILIDGTNSPYMIKNYLLQAKKYQIPAYELKKIKAYLVNISQ
jgi:competence protein ComEC